LTKYLNIAWLFLILVTTGLGQVQKVKITAVKVEGNERLSAEDIIRSSRLYVGREIDMEDIQKSLKTLWKLNRFGNLEVYVDEETDEGVSLRIVVEELPILAEVKFNGNKKLSNTTLKDAIGLIPGQIISDYDVFLAEKKIREEYHDRHYHDVEISTELVKGDLKFSRILVFTIKEHKKMKIKEINFSGNEEFSDYRLLRQFKSTKPWHIYLPWRGKFDETKYDEDKGKLKSFYRRKGFRDFRILKDEVAPREDHKGLAINLDLYEGPKYYFRNITWEGNIIHSDEELSARLDIYKGDVYNEEQFQTALSERVNPLYMDEGYFYFQLTPEITPIGEDSLDVHFLITENQIVKIRKILISGNDRTHENVIRRELRVVPGEIFNRKKLLDSYRDIIMLDYFETVVPNVLPVSEDQIDITIDVKEKSADRANFSLSYNKTYGFTGGGGIELRNFRGRGENLSFNYQRGIGSGSQNSSNYYYTNSSNVASYQSLSLGFTNPWVFDTPNLFGVSLYYSERGQGQGNYYPFDINNSGGSLRVGRRFKWPDRYFRGSWVLRASNTSYYASSQSDLTEYFGTGIESLIKVGSDGRPYFITSGRSITQNVTRDSRNHPEFPTDGSLFSWTTTFSGSILGGDEDYHKHEFTFDWFNPTVGKFVLHQKLKAGVIKEIHVSGSQRSVIPPSARFLLGGSGIPYGEMLRGYDDNTIGPIGTFSPRGGNVLLKYSLELRFPFSESPTVYGLVFGEAGNVWENFNSVDPFKLYRSAGMGIRMYMPMLGMLGFDMGYGFDDTIYDVDKKPQGWNYHLLFGMPF